MLEDATKRDLKQTPDHDVYSACWQCQPYCQGGKGEGVKDKKGRGAPNIVATLRLIKANKPKMFVSENSPNLVAPKRIDVTLKGVRTLREQNYRVFCKLVCMRKYVAQRRRRFYLVAIKKRNYFRRFKWPKRKMKGWKKASETWYKDCCKATGKVRKFPKHNRKHTH